MSDKDIIILNTSHINPVTQGDTSNQSLYKMRTSSLNFGRKSSDPLVTIYVQAYNRLNKTMKCVESILKYTEGDYELLLIDNGSTDGTLEYFKSISYSRKKILRVTDNVGSGYPVKTAMNMCNGRYIVTISNDTYVTSNWLRNLINCMESDESIGLVTPMSTNVSNLQQPPNFCFSSLDEFFIKAEDYNKSSDPKKWQERLRLIPILSVFKPELLNVLGSNDPAFVHDFSEDDLCARIRRTGYKMILAGDTIVHHDHNFRQLEDKDEKNYNDSLVLGRDSFKKKYKGIDAWDDILNFDLDCLQYIDNPPTNCPSILGIDVKCGQPILSISNRLRELSIFSNNRLAFTTKAKYYDDLQFVCDSQQVICDRMEYISDYYEANSVDYVMLGEPINTYDQPAKIFKKILGIVKKGGNLIFKLRNCVNIYTYLNLANKSTTLDPEMPIQISIEELINLVKMFNPQKINVSAEPYSIGAEDREAINQICKMLSDESNINNVYNKMITKDYLFCLKK